MQRPLFNFYLFLFTLSFLSFVRSSPLHGFTNVTSVINIALTQNINFVNLKDVLKSDQLRAADLISKAKQVASSGPHFLHRSTSVAVQNQYVTYTADVGVGNPATRYTLLIDTGSSNTWVGAGKPYQPTSTSEETSDSVSVTYGSGSFSGTEYTDQVNLGNGLVIGHQSIGVANTTEGFSGVDGILGIGPTGLTIGTLSPSSDEIPTVTDNLFSQGTIPENAVGIYYTPSTDPEDGELTFGGADPSKITGDITYVPITQTSPANRYWGIDQSMTYGTDTTIIPSAAGIVDTGTTLIMLASDYFQKYQAATGAVLDDATGLLKLTHQQFADLQSLYFVIGSTTFEFTANAQIWPRRYNSMVGGSPGAIYLIIADLGQQSGQGFDFINGYAFLQRFYSVYDTSNQQVGFATTAFTDSTSN